MFPERMERLCQAAEASGADRLAGMKARGFLTSGGLMADSFGYEFAMQDKQGRPPGKAHRAAAIRSTDPTLSIPGRCRCAREADGGG